MHLLTLISCVYILERMIELLSLYHCGKVCCGIKSRTVGLSDDTWRNLLLIISLRNIDYQCTLALVCVALVHKALQHILYIRLSIGLTLPYIEAHVKIVIVPLKVCYGDIHYMLPDCSVASVSSLKHNCSLMCRLRKFSVLL